MLIEPLHEEFGARISAVDLSLPLDAQTFAEVDAAINRYSMLLFENQAMYDAAQLDFTCRFGQLEEEHVTYYGQGKVVYIGLVGNIDANGEKVAARQVNSARGNEMWHSDSSFREIPAMYSILSAYEVPDEGGETEFASARAAYQRLDESTREQIQDLIGIHDYIYSRTKISEDAVNENQRTYMHPVRQRLVRQNPVTGDKNLFVGSHVKEIEGMPDSKARPLLKRLIDEVTRPQSVYRHRWRVGDVVMWDNRCILHRGCGYDAENYRRRMHQTRVRGWCPSIAEAFDPA
ncbi:MAG: TauD/TfdA family dioxygenase [Gammaproteobacteria bacterium]|nr:TauD/TfdA family dioxygenase [Gammaproteobacteria bacterium]MDH3534524.1 TauD/TfdA family dioxygenase [Gammaproteobacteria bacterium]